MRSYLSQSKFFQKMKKKPEQLEVLNNLDKYSLYDIEALSGPHFPAWIKEQLMELKKRDGKTAEDVANEIAAKMIAASQQNNIK